MSSLWRHIKKIFVSTPNKKTTTTQQHRQSTSTIKHSSKLMVFSIKPSKGTVMGLAIINIVLAILSIVFSIIYVIGYAISLHWLFVLFLVLLFVVVFLFLPVEILLAIYVYLAKPQYSVNHWMVSLIVSIIGCFFVLVNIITAFYYGSIPIGVILIVLNAVVLLATKLSADGPSSSSSSSAPPPTTSVTV